MIVLKFGGASVKDAESVRNITNIIKEYDKNMLVVVSAMAKTTVALEKIAESYFYQKKDLDSRFAAIKKFHTQIAADLFAQKSHIIHVKLDNYFKQLYHLTHKAPSLNFNFEYAQIVSFGELLSTSIVSEWLNANNLQNQWVDIRKYLKTDNNWREANIDWELSTAMVRAHFDFKKTRIYTTQGFIGATINAHNTTLGLEGSDFTASALAFMLNAEKVVIWKDVEGIFSADPKIYPNAQKIDEINYKEAVELAYYGAKIIHPKTIKPIENKEIPLYVKSFISPEKPGTVIRKTKSKLSFVPIFIFKENQILISTSPTDFSFMDENNISKIFALMSEFGVKANLIESSAISFSVCADNNPNKIVPLLKELNKYFKVKYNENLQLITIRHYTKKAINKVTFGKNILVQQKSRHTARFVVG